MMSLIQNVHKAINDDNTTGYLQTAYDFQDRVKGLRFGYIPGVIRHYFHGQKVNRKYRERWQILVENQYDPKKDLTEDENGLLIPSELCPPKLLEDIMNYFEQRNEDEFFYKTKK